METADQAFQSFFAGIPTELHLLTGIYSFYINTIAAIHLIYDLAIAVELINNATNSNEQIDPPDSNEATKLAQSALRFLRMKAAKVMPLFRKTTTMDTDVFWLVFV
jgi:hypothetical protein